MFKKIAISVVSSASVLMAAGSVSAQTWANTGTTYDVGGISDLQHSVTLSGCNIAYGDLQAKVRGTAQNELDVGGVSYPFQKIFSLCGTVEALDYDWKLQITGPGSGGVYPVVLKGVAARTILGSKCKGDISGFFDNNGSILTASGVIPVVSGSTSPPTCTVAVDVDAPGLQIVP